MIPGSASGFGLVHMKLLIVEDEADLRGTLAQALREEGYNAIVLDVMLPGMDGWEILRRLRVRKKTPVLLLTARNSSSDRVRGLDLGSDDYVTKPFDLPELLARLRALIRRSAGEASSTLSFGSVAVDMARRVVRVAGAPVELTAREYSLVELLATRRGKVVSRTELYDHLFAEEDESFSNLLDVHVCNVRKKIGKDFIQTRRGHGYVLEENP